MLGMVGHIVGRVVGRTVPTAGADAADAEVARVARPLPVIGVMAELADALGRSADEAHIFEDFIFNKEILLILSNIKKKKQNWKH